MSEPGEETGGRGIVDRTRLLPRHPVKRFRVRDPSQIRWIVLHHTGGSPTQTPEEIAWFHIRIRDWSGIGYHYLIYRDGTVYKTRPVGAIPACVTNHNLESLCLCFVGDCSTAPPSPAALDACTRLIDALRRAFPQIQGVRGHREMPGQDTVCPGAAFNLVTYRAQLGAPA